MIYEYRFYLLGSLFWDVFLLVAFIEKQFFSSHFEGRQFGVWPKKDPGATKKYDIANLRFNTPRNVGK